MRRLLYSFSLVYICTTLFWLEYNWNNLSFSAPLVAKSPVVENLLISDSKIHQQVSSMNLIVFNFRSNVSIEEQDALLLQINSWNGISKAAHLKPDAKSPAILRMCYSYVSSSTELAVLLERLSALPQIESASIPAQRQLL
jgi:hypothetical protein